MRRLLVATLFGLSTRGESTSSPVPAMQRVITMLNNLLSDIEAEGKEDDEKHGKFLSWAATEMSDLGAEITRLQGDVELLESTRDTLNAKKGELDNQLTPLKAEIQTTQGQMTFATDKRNTEKTAFTSEQADFDSAISACGKAVTLLGKHYGDGDTAAKKPDFMSLVSRSIESMRRVSKRLTGKTRRVANHLLLLQQTSSVSGPFDSYQDASGDAMSIVDQIKVLKASFEEDKKSCIEDEERLQKMYDKLMTEKGAALATMKSERDELESRLQQTNQDIAENAGSLARAEKDLGDNQASLSAVTTQKDEAVQMYNIRVQDRRQETEAVTLANEKLAAYREGLFIQRDATLVSRSRKESKASVHRATSLRSKTRCVVCERAAVLLSKRAKSLHSSMLMAAVQATEGGALDDIITAIDGLIDRLKEEQKAEKEHKDWCEKETKDTQDKKNDHSGIVETLKGVLASLSEVVNEKVGSLQQNADVTNTEETDFDSLSTARDESKGEFEHDHQEHVEAIQALNEAIDILAKYYASKKGAALLQEPELGGGKAVELLSGTRTEFETTKTHLEKEEAEAIKDFTDVKATHLRTMSDLDDEKNTLTVEKQTAEASIKENTEDKKTSENEIRAADVYLGKLARSCGPLIEHYDERKNMRNEEKKALEDAIDVLQQQA